VVDLVNGLGEKKEWNKYKIFYLAFMVLVVAFLAFSWIGQTTIYKKQMISFYAWLGLISLAFILFDLATLHHFEEIDSVTIEKTPINPKYIILIGFAFALVLGIRIYTTNSAWVGYPKFQFFDNKYANSLLSGVAGVVENWFFFAFLTPTLFAIFLKYIIKNPILTSIITIFLIAFIFMVYHIFIYATNQLALLSVFLFGLINTILIISLKSVIVSDFLHFANNFVASLISAGIAIIWV
jgi:hypothetical protein